MKYNIKKLLNEQFNIGGMNLANAHKKVPTPSIFNVTSYDKYNKMEFGYSVYYNYKNDTAFYIDDEDYQLNKDLYNNDIISPENYLGVFGGIDSEGNVIVISDNVMREDSYNVAEMKSRLYRINNIPVKWSLPTKNDIIDFMCNCKEIMKNSHKMRINNIPSCWVKNTNRTTGIICNIVVTTNTIEFKTVNKNEKYNYFFITKIKCTNKEQNLLKRKESFRKNRCTILNTKE